MHSFLSCSAMHLFEDSYKNLQENALFLHNLARSYYKYQSCETLAVKVFLERFLEDIHCLYQSCIK